MIKKQNNRTVEDFYLRVKYLKFSILTFFDIAGGRLNRGRIESNFAF